MGKAKIEHVGEKCEKLKEGDIVLVSRMRLTPFQEWRGMNYGEGDLFLCWDRDILATCTSDGDLEVLQNRLLCKDISDFAQYSHTGLALFEWTKHSLTVTYVVEGSPKFLNQTCLIPSKSGFILQHNDEEYRLLNKEDVIAFLEETDEALRTRIMPRERRRK